MQQLMLQLNGSQPKRCCDRIRQQHHRAAGAQQQAVVVQLAHHLPLSHQPPPVCHCQVSAPNAQRAAQTLMMSQQVCMLGQQPNWPARYCSCISIVLPSTHGGKHERNSSDVVMLNMHAGDKAVRQSKSGRFAADVASQLLCRRSTSLAREASAVALTTRV